MDPRELVGSWSIERTLLDRSLGQGGSFRGTLAVEPTASGLRWDESGTLRWDGRDLPAQRSLRLHRVDGRWWMAFDDGRPFHPWVVGEPVVHPCAADTYRGLIEQSGADELTITWDVTGPTKDQLIVSRLIRLIRLA